jgi:hypothetical protein
MYGVAWFAGAVLLGIASVLLIAEVVCMREMLQQEAKAELDTIDGTK